MTIRELIVELQKLGDDTFDEEISIDNDGVFPIERVVFDSEGFYLEAGKESYAEIMERNL
jgi:hypothetical protein